MVLKTQILQREHVFAGSRYGLGLGQVVRRLLCGLVLGGSFVGGSAWAQLPESATIDPATLEQELRGEEVSEEATAQKAKLTDEGLEKLDTAAQALFVNAAETVVAIDGGSGVIKLSEWTGKKIPGC